MGSTTNTSGSANTAIGTAALHINTTGTYNTATGQGAMWLNTTGRNNTAVGQIALRSNTTGSYNIGIGSNGGAALTTGSNNIDIGNSGLAAENRTIRIGTVSGALAQTNTYIAGIYGVTVNNISPMPVYIDTSGHLGTISSSARFKEAIRPMNKASEPILSLQPVTFRYKPEFGADKTPQFGLVAEEVEKVDPELVVHDEQGKPYSVRYDAVNAMLLNEFQKEHHKVEAQESTIAQLEAKTTRQEQEIAALTASVKEQAAQIQKVNARLAVDRPSTRVVSASR